MSRRIKIVAWIVAVVGLLGGCMSPDRADMGMLEKYHQALVRRGPQHREASTGLGELKPAEVTALPALKADPSDAAGRVQIRLPLEEAIVRTLANSPQIRVVSFDPAIARQRAIEAAAAFDYILFGGWNYSSQDVQTASVFASGMTKTRTYQAGVKQSTITGADWSLAYTLTGTRTQATGFTTLTNYYEPTIDLAVTQPLLRDGWWNVTLAELRLAEVNEKTSAAAFRQTVEEIVAQVIGTYWALVQARVDLAIQEQLLASAIETLHRVEARAELDAPLGQVKQVKAAVEGRRALLVRAHKAVQDVQDSLLRLMADPQANLLTDCEILPTTDALTQRVETDLTDRLLTALKHNPALEQARLALQAADINVQVARNQTLPRLDLTASASLQALAGAVHEAHENLGTGDYVSYAVGLTAEYPIGNRAALAALRRQQLARQQTLAGIQDAADQVAQDLKERLRQVETAYQEVLAQRSAVQAALVYLQSLEDTEQVRGRLTPEFLQVKLQAQESLALSQHAELTAIVQYNVALADLERVSGTILEVQQVKIALPPATDLTGPIPLAEPPARAEGAPVSVMDTYRQALIGKLVAPQE